METLNDWLNSATEMLGKLNGAPGYVLVFVSCIALGYVLRNVKRFPNDGIPVAIMLWGGMFNMLIAHDEPIALRIWIARNLILGVIIGVAAWLIHKYGISKLEDRIPWFKRQEDAKVKHETQMLKKRHKAK